MLSTWKYPWLKKEKSLEEKLGPVNNAEMKRLAKPKVQRSKVRNDDAPSIYLDRDSIKPCTAHIEKLAQPHKKTSKFREPEPVTYRNNTEFPPVGNLRALQVMAQPVKVYPRFTQRLQQYEAEKLVHREKIEALGPLHNKEYYDEQAIPLLGEDKIDIHHLKDEKSRTTRDKLKFSSSMARVTHSPPRIPGTGNQPTRTQLLKARSQSPRKKMNNSNSKTRMAESSDSKSKNDASNQEDETTEKPEDTNNQDKEEKNLEEEAGEESTKQLDEQPEQEQESPKEVDEMTSTSDMNEVEQQEQESVNKEEEKQ